MPAKTSRQRKAAGAELGRRRRGVKRQKKATRPFGSASTKTLRDMAKKKR
jgi:hypothetical protein